MCSFIIAFGIILSISWAENNRVVSATVVVITGSEPSTLTIEEVPKKKEPTPIVKPNNAVTGRFKAYMDYRNITSRSSMQWEMQQSATTDINGFRTYNGLYMIAVGTGYAKTCGVELQITLSSGVVFNAITGDIKSDKGTDHATHTYMRSDKSVVEFIVDTHKISTKCRTSGDMSNANLLGDIVKIEKM